MDPTEFEKIFGVKSPEPSVPEGQQPQAQPQAQPKQEPTDTGTPQAQPQLELDPQAAQSLQPFGAELGITQNPDGSFSAPDVAPEDNLAQRENAVGMAGMVAPVTGGLKSVFETKDFLFGDTPVDRQSGFRQFVEDVDQHIKQESPILGGLASGIGQFTTAMVGLGKLGALAKAVPIAGEALASGQAWAEAYKYGKMGLEAGKAALAGAIAFDPHEQRLSNLIQDTPLANPFNAWLAAKPGDSAALGRLKNSMESLGMDAAIIGTFTGGLKIWRYLKEGNTQAASRAVSQLEADMHQQIAQEQQANASTIPQGAESLDGRPIQMDRQPVTDGSQSLGPATQSDAVSGQSAVDAGKDAGNVATINQADTVQQGASNGPQPDGAQVAQASDIPVEVTSTPTKAMEAAGVAKPQTFKNKVEFNPLDIAGSPARPSTQDVPKPGLLDQLDFHLENAEKDWDTMSQHGGWSGTIDSGKRLSPDMGAFYDRFRTDNDVIQAVDLAVNHKAEQLAAQGFRVKLTDSKLQRQVNAFASLAGVDPAGLAGILQQAGEASRTLTAKMIVVGSLASKAFQDASLLAMRRKIGDYTQFGGKEALEAEIAKRFSIATTFLKLTDDIRAQGGRTLRASRGKPFDPSMFEDISKDRFYELLVQAEGSPDKLKMLAEPGIARKIMDTVNYLRVSSLVSGPKTQLINIMSNGYMVGVRPMERILGSVPGAIAGNDASKALIKESIRQYTYMGSAFYDGFSQAVKAFASNDGVLRGHGSEMSTGSRRWQVPGTQGIGTGYFRPWDSTYNVLYNAFSVPLTVWGLPTRALGSVDELVKQIVYRSKLAARAHMDGTTQAIQAGLKGDAANKFVKSYVSTRLENAFDAEGRGLDPEALREANIATFQQDLLPGTIGHGVQTLLANEKGQFLRLILPFVKTPTNVIRYGWKMTPGLNMFQEEYRQMFSGALGQEAKAQAIGQMTMGALFMGAAGYIGAQGMVTGGGPSDSGLKSQLLATGWQPYSIVAKHDDGTTSYIPFNRYDPVGLPFGIIADIQDAIHIMGEDASKTPEIENAIGALTISLAKQFTSRTYLLSLNQALEALSDPEKRGLNFAGGLAQSVVPFSGATRQLSTDPYLRDARSIADKMMQVIPGMSQNLPPKYNWLGQPVLNRQGLWSDTNGSLVDQETIRLGLEGGTTMGPPSPSLGNKVDLRDITLTTGDNAYQKYQELAGKPSPNVKSLRDMVADAMRSEAYTRAPDGPVDVRGTKQWLLAARVGKYREAAMRRLKADPNVRNALMAATRKVVDHYQHLKQEQTPEQKANVENIIKAFGAGNQ